MWTLLPKENAERYFQQYMYLSPYAEELTLHNGDGCLFLPRYFNFNFPSPLLTFFVDKNWIPKTADIEMKPGFELRPKQHHICKIAIDIINSTERCGGIIKARPGAGKTVMAVNIAAITKCKTLIVIDNNNLAGQWRDAITKFSNVKEDEIGFIGGGKFDIEEDHPFTICLVQTLMSKAKTDMKEIYYKFRDCGFDLVFFDECHQTTCGPRYATASLFLNTTNVFGLSATPFADDLHKVLMDNALGDIIAQDGEYDLVPDINFAYFDSGLTGKYGRAVNYGADMIRKRAIYVSKLMESVAYTNHIVALTRQLLNDGHRIFIVVFTVDLVKHIHDSLALAGIESRQFYSKKKEIDKENDKVVVATYKYAGAGFDMPALSAAILGTPLSGKKSLIQVIGRILREHPDKLNAVVYDLIDTGFGGMFANTVKRKEGILVNEFKCKFNHINL